MYIFNELGKIKAKYVERKIVCVCHCCGMTFDLDNCGRQMY